MIILKVYKNHLNFIRIFDDINKILFIKVNFEKKNDKIKRTI